MIDVTGLVPFIVLVFYWLTAERLLGDAELEARAARQREALWKADYLAALDDVRRADPGPARTSPGGTASVSPPGSARRTSPTADPTRR